MPELNRKQVEKIIEIFGGAPVPGEEVEIGQVYQWESNDKGAFICHPIPDKVLRKQLEKEGCGISDDLWNDALAEVT